VRAAPAVAGDLIPPHGGRLVDLVVPADQREALRRYALSLPAIQLTPRALCDLELLATGGFSPLDRFMGQADYRRVLAEMRLAGGHVFPIPVTLPVTSDTVVALDADVALCDERNRPLAVMTVEEVYRWDRRELGAAVLGTNDPRHPLVAEAERWGDRFVSGPMRVIDLPLHFDFKELRLTPVQTRQQLTSLGHANVVAFQTRNALHRAHEEMTKRAIAQVDGTLLLHPVVGMSKPGDVDHYTRVRTYRILTERYYDRHPMLLALLPLAMRLAGPREALWHAVIRRNYGANHLIVGRDHASPGLDSRGRPFYGPYDAQELVDRHAAEIGVRMVPFRELVYLPDEDRYEEASKVGDGAHRREISGAQMRADYLDRGRELPTWIARPEVARILSEAYPPLHERGVCIWFTGLSGSGKSTTAEVLTVLLQERGRQVTLLDGDVVRTHLSKGLGFSKEDRDTNIRRIGFVAAEIARHGGVAICAAVSPYRATRNDVRSMVGADRFVEVFVDTPIAVCEARDVKGLYARARRGEVSGFTGVDDPYEAPETPEIVLDTVHRSAVENARRIVDYLSGRGFLLR
jgi:sulfate adenylyltransferase